MVLFPDDRPQSAASGTRNGRIGTALLAIALVGAVAFSLVPSPYVIERPGPVFNTLGTVTAGEKTVPMISIPTEKTYPTSGTLDLLTVDYVGNRSHLPNWFQVLSAWFDPSRAVVPLDSVYPPGQSVKEAGEVAAIQMSNSQKDAIAAAMVHLGMSVPSTVTVMALTPNAPSAGILKAGDLILTVNGDPVKDVTELREAIAASGAGNPLTIGIRRGSETRDVSVLPELSGGTDPVPIIGIEAAVDYQFPFPVSIQLENVGGPSAGQMFALGIIDKLTPGALTGGASIAGTGTISSSGEVGTIGGIRQKMYGARHAGATWFLAPAGNCDEVVGHVPDGLTVIAVHTLDDSVAAVQAIGTHADTGALPSCPAR
ncbi:PDZ domain-containing protein [Parafrigoribacterium mesophilum]|uniref:YlbL family protein n=1 Tax=Parafrigoribacterium mesophilum TaxID=433646 RepID=UPI0031FD876D